MLIRVDGEPASFVKRRAPMLIRCFAIYNKLAVTALIAMFEEIIKSLKATLYDRTVSPLFGTFVASWALWNYKLIVVLFSSKPPETTFLYIETVLYPTWLVGALFLILGPLASALLFIYLYPWPARKTFEYSRRRQQELLQLRQEIDKTSLVSREVWEQTQDEMSRLVAEHVREVERLERERESFRKLYLDRNQQIERLTEDLETLRVAKARATLKLTQPITEYQLIGRRVRLFLSSTPNLESSKLLELRAEGSIGHGRNDNEWSWSIEDGQLRFGNVRSETQSAFSWDDNWQAFRSPIATAAGTSTRAFVLVES